jgi:hypothetical protein
MDATSTYCTSCSAARRDQGLEPQELLQIGTTENKKINVYWCQQCDGPRDVSKAAN